MANTGWVAPTANFTQTTLNGAISSGAGTITLNSVAGLQAPGYVVIDRTDSAGTATPNNREVVSYTGISGSNLTGCSRGADNSTARQHADGAVVEANPTVGMWNDLATIVNTAVGVDGYLKAINSPVSIAQLNAGFFIAISPASIAQGQFINMNVSSIASITGAVIKDLITVQSSSIASLSRIEAKEFTSSSAASVSFLYVKTLVDVSSASVTGIGLFPVFHGFGGYSGPTTGIGGILTVPKASTLNWVSVITNTVASAASVVFDLKKNGSSVFAGVTTPTIVGGGTYISTASLNTKALVPGDVLRADLLTLTASGVITDVTVQAGTL